MPQKKKDNRISHEAPTLATSNSFSDFMNRMATAIRIAGALGVEAYEG